MKFKDFLLEGYASSTYGIVDDNGCLVQCPDEVGDDFIIVSNGDKLSSFKGAPKKVNGSFKLANTNNNMELTSFEYAPTDIAKDFFVTGLRNFKSINGLDFIGGEFYMHMCTFVDNPFNAHANIKVGGDVKFFQCNFKTGSLVGINETFSRIDGVLQLTECTDIQEGGVGVLLIDGLEHVNVKDPSYFIRWSKLREAMTIINRYLRQDKGNVYGCQKELIDVGLEEFAQI